VVNFRLAAVPVDCVQLYPLEAFVDLTPDPEGTASSVLGYGVLCVVEFVIPNREDGAVGGSHIVQDVVERDYSLLKRLRRSVQLVECHQLIDADEPSV